MADNLPSFDENADRYFHGPHARRVHVTRAAKVFALLCAFCHIFAMIYQGDIVLNLLALFTIQYSIEKQNRFCLLVYIGVSGIAISALCFITIDQIVSTVLMATTGYSFARILDSSINCALLTLLIIIGVYMLTVFGNFYHYITMRERTSSIPEKTQPAPEIIVATANSDEEPPAYSEKMKIDEEEKPPAYTIA
ncbi:hypothetical protein PFISCL1PPCAC_211 [Pristionchus fissidentatus]|uniref:Uncharacterized protein n=1 Tax=Pristionchus fissidentatus TaxID=1538716 RepID=A0AAV5UPE9_9BILA|nr:hypothetical protein PFISCL1PPCAC_211 [Pristionchus fissidentatus]